MQGPYALPCSRPLPRELVIPASLIRGGAQATRSCIHISTGARQMGHDSILAEQGPQAHRCPHGPATCDFGLEKETMHVVSPPRVDSGTAARPVSTLSSASESAATGCSPAGKGSPVPVGSSRS